jgi:hypothetical protein
MIKPDITQSNPFVKWNLVEKNPTAKKENKGKPKISATSFNMWAESPSAWISKYILQVDQEPNQAMHRGSTAEKVLYNVLMGHSKVEDIAKESESMFRQKTTFVGEEEDKVKNIKDLVGYKGRTKTYGGYVKVAYDKLKDFGKPINYQQKVWFEIPYFKVWADGFKDFGYDDFDLDLKTSSKMQGALPLAYRRQLTLYRMQSNKEQKLLLATKEKAELYILEDTYEQSKEEIYHVINTMANALSECNSVEELLLRYYPNWEFWKLSIKQKDGLRKLIKDVHEKHYWQERQDIRELASGV